MGIANIGKDKDGRNSGIEGNRDKLQATSDQNLLYFFLRLKKESPHLHTKFIVSEINEKS